MIRVFRNFSCNLIFRDVDACRSDVERLFHHGRSILYGFISFRNPKYFTKRTGELHWEILLRARAIENYCYVLAPNQFGIDGNNVETYGHSMVIDPHGNIIGILPNQKEDILMVELSFKDNLKYPFFS